MSFAAEKIDAPDIGVQQELIRRNAALAALPPPSFASLASALRYRDVIAGDNLWHPSSAATVYFPLSAIISVVLPMPDGKKKAAVEVGIIGREAMVLSKPGMRGIALTEGKVASMPAELFAEAARRDHEIARVGALSEAFLLEQAQRLVVCNALHHVVLRFACWLGEISDRSDDNVLMVTQEAIGRALGTNRQMIMVGAQRLKDKGAITYRHGELHITDRDRLTACACTCYEVLSPAHWPFQGSGISNQDWGDS